MLVPWKKSYNQPRQHIKKKRHYFADKCSSVKADFSNLLHYQATSLDNDHHAFYFHDGQRSAVGWAKDWSFGISPSNEYSGSISLRMDWLDLLATQGTPKSLPQPHSSKASIHGYSAFFMVQLSRPYMTTGKTIILTRQTFVGKVN